MVLKYCIDYYSLTWTSWKVKLECIPGHPNSMKGWQWITIIIVSPVRSTYGGYYGLVVVTPRPQTLHRSHDNLKNPYRIASIFYM